MITEIELQGIIQELESAISEMFPDATITNVTKEIDASIVIEIITPNDDIPEIEEEFASKSAELSVDYDYEFVFVVKNESSDDSPDED